MATHKEGRTTCDTCGYSCLTDDLWRLFQHHQANPECDANYRAWCKRTCEASGHAWEEHPRFSYTVTQRYLERCRCDRCGLVARNEVNHGPLGKLYYIDEKAKKRVYFYPKDFKCEIVDCKRCADLSSR
jgi:hypothetical protein